MTWLLDTNVISESIKPSPNEHVAHWLASVDEEAVFLSVATLGELRFGIERLADGRRKQQLTTWIANDVQERFEGRLLPIDEGVALVWATLMAQAMAAGRTLSAIDGFVAATASTHRLTLVTRNTRDFAATGVRLFDPWTASDAR